MIVRELIEELNRIVSENPEILDYEVNTEGYCCGTNEVEVGFGAVCIQ